MKIKFLIVSVIMCLNFSCLNSKNQKPNNIATKHNQRITSTDSLIAELAHMKTDTLDCSADIYWQIVGKGKEYIPKLIESLTDTTPTNIYHGCKIEKLNIGELSYFALEEIGDFPAFVVTQIQFDVITNKDGWKCWSFYSYLFENQNKKEYQRMVRDFYQKSSFEFIKYPDSYLTTCKKKYGIKGMYKWKE